MRPEPEQTRREQPARPGIAELSSEIGALKAQALDARAVLTSLQQELVEADRQLGESSALRLRDTNERLVVSMLRTQAENELSTRALRVASRSAELDPLTQLPNRTLLHDRFTQAIANARRHGTRLALLFLDLNEFKQVNDTLGHSIGDQVLQHVAESLSSLVRASDTVSRHGGDEFLILLSDVAHTSDAAIIAEKIIAAIAAPYRIGVHVLQLATSIGVSFFPDDGDDVETLIARADAAMYRAKRLPAGGIVFHDDSPGYDEAPSTDFDMARRVTSRQELAIAEHERWHADLREANEQLVLAALRAKELQLAAELEQARLKAELQVARTVQRGD